MDADRFDGLAKAFSSSATRRGILRLLTALPLSGGLLTLAALVVAGASARSPVPAVARDEPRADLEIAVLTILTLLVTPIIWPHYYVVLVAPVAVICVYIWRSTARWLLAVLALSLLVLWLPRDLHQWLSRFEVVPRSLGTLQLPALLVMYGLGLWCLGSRADRSALADSGQS